MTTQQKNLRRDFWNSRTSLRIVREQLGDEHWQPPADKEVWEGLRDQVLAANTAGLITERQHRGLPPRVVSVLKGGVELLLAEDPVPDRDDGVATYLSFRRSLSAFARLLRTNRLWTERKNPGVDWGVIESGLDDPLELVFFKRLRQLSAAEIPVAMNALEDISRSGFSYRFAGGGSEHFQNRDCGIKALVVMARRTTRRAEKQTRNRGDTQPNPAESDSGSKKRLKCKELTAMRFELSGTNGKCVLDGKDGILFSLLSFAKRDWKDVVLRNTAAQVSEVVTCETICRALWPEPQEDELDSRSVKRPNKSLRSLTPKAPGVCPPLLRTRKRELEIKLRGVVGNPRKGEFWIEAVKKKGFRLSKRLILVDETSPELLGASKVDRGHRPK